MIRLAAGTLAAVVLGLVVLLPGIDSAPLTDPDEGRQAEVAREVFVAESLAGRVVPHLDGEPYHHKPILFYWLASAAYAANGVSGTSVRLVPMLAGVMLIALVHLWTAAVFGLGAARWSACALATSIGGALLARFVNLDTLLTLWVTAGAMAVERWAVRGRSGWLVAASAAAAFGFLTKGLVAPLFVLVVGAVAWVLERPRVRPRTLLVAAATFAVIVSPWIVAAWQADPDYLPEFLLRHHLDRYTSAGSPHPHGVLFYVPVLALGLFPWTTLAPAAAIRARTTRWDATALLCAAWAVTVVVFFSLSRGKLVTYVFPALPPLCVLLGRYVAALRATGPASDRERGALVAGGWVTAAVLCAAPLVVIAIAPRVYGGKLLIPAMPALLMIPLGIGLAVLVARGALRAVPPALAAGMVAVLVVYHGWSSPRIGAVTSTAALAASLSTSARAKVVTYAAHAHSLGFYLGRAIPTVRQAGQLGRLAAADQPLFVVTNRRHAAEVERSGVTHLWADTGRWRLYGTLPPATVRRPSPADALPDGHGPYCRVRAGWHG